MSGHDTFMACRLFDAGCRASSRRGGGLWLVVAALLLATAAFGFEAEPVFDVTLVADREPAVAGQELKLAVVVDVDAGWHVNSDRPSEDFLIPTTVAWELPAGWPEPSVLFPADKKIKFSFSEIPLSVWEGRTVPVATVSVPAEAQGRVALSVAVTAQACNDIQCLPPTPVKAKLELTLAPAGTSTTTLHTELFAQASSALAISEPSAAAARPGGRLGWPLGLALAVVGAVVLVLVRPARHNAVLDRVARTLSVVAVAAGVLLLEGQKGRVELQWQAFDRGAFDAALAAGRPVIVDFTASWCAPCKELDERTFSNPKVAKELESFARFKVDLTTTSDFTDALRRELGVAGPPTIIMFRDGKEAFRFAGFEPPDRFLRRLGGGATGQKVEQRLAALSLPWQIGLVFLAGLALNLTPCVYPLIPITVGFFSAQADSRGRGTFLLALAYAGGMAVTYTSLGVAASLTGQLFGAALQHPLVVLAIVVVLIALASSMFGLWELAVPGWASRLAKGRSGVPGALAMGLVVGLVAAPCIGPFVLGLLTYVGQQGSPLLGLVLFFSLSVGLGLPYLLLGTFTGLLNRLPASGAWMVSVRKVFGVLLLALAAQLGKPLLAASLGSLLVALTLLVGGAYLLLVERTGHEQPGIDRVMRLVAAGLVVAGVLQLPIG